MEEKIYSRGQDKGESGQDGGPGRTRGDPGEDQRAQSREKSNSSSIQMGEPDPRGRLASEQLSPPEGADLDQSKPKRNVPTAAVKERGLTSREYQGSSP